MEHHKRKTELERDAIEQEMQKGRSKEMQSSRKMQKEDIARKRYNQAGNGQEL